jgi:hypothetical protein
LHTGSVYATVGFTEDIKKKQAAFMAKRIREIVEEKE